MRLAKFTLCTSLSVLAVACSGEKTEPASQSAPPLLEKLAPKAGKDASADFVGRDGTVIGHATVTGGDNGVLFRLDLEGIPEGWHGMHLHQTGDCSDNEAGFKSSGGHINPDGNEHGFLNLAGFERADMANIYAGADGRATAEFLNSYVRLKPGESAAAAVTEGGILMDENGFAIVVHENPDDHETQPIGGAGPRIACAAFAG